MSEELDNWQKTVENRLAVLVGAVIQINNSLPEDQGFDQAIWDRIGLYNWVTYEVEENEQGTNQAEEEEETETETETET